jgi:predicted transposase YdaD
LIRQLYSKGLEEQDIRNLYRFIDWVIILPERLENKFWEELKQFEEEQSMPYLTTGERIGYKRGREEGRQEGRQEGKQALILRLLSRRFGELSPQVRACVESMNSTQLETLGEALLDFTGVDDLNNWLQEN